jgi:hypothetical protein
VREAQIRVPGAGPGLPTPKPLSQAEARARAQEPVVAPPVVPVQAEEPVGAVVAFQAQYFVPGEAAPRLFDVTSRVPAPGELVQIARLETQFSGGLLGQMPANSRLLIADLARITILMDMPPDLYQWAQADWQLLQDLGRASAAHEAAYFRRLPKEGGEAARSGLLAIHSAVGDLRLLVEKPQAAV